MPSEFRSGTSNSEHLDSALELINRLAQVSSGGGCIYRGETKLGSSHISSSLYRHISKQYPNVSLPVLDMEMVQEEFLEIAKSFTTEQDHNQILAAIRHNGGSVNLVDFTTDYNVALFSRATVPHPTTAKMAA